MTSSIPAGSEMAALVKQLVEPFELFPRVYLFGSALGPEPFYNDIDVLIIYADPISHVEHDLQTFASELEKVSGMPVDLTALSCGEARETGFLDKISPHCLRIK